MSSTSVTSGKTAESPGASQANSDLRHRLRAGLPTIAVVTILAMIALWGHSTDWTMPKFSSLIGGGPEQAEDWCPLHDVPMSICIECNPKLTPAEKDYGWCKEHGVAQCPLDHPDVAEVSPPYQPTRDDFERAQRALELRPRAENNSRCKLHDRRIQFASKEAFEKAGVEIAIVAQRPVIEAVVANGEVIYDQTRLAHLNSRVMGTVWRVQRGLGDHVKKGDVLALVDAVDVGKAKAEFLQAIVQQRLKETLVERLRPLAKDGGVSGRQLREAEAALEEARIRLVGAQQALVNLGLPIHAEDFSKSSTEAMADKIRFLGIPSEYVAEIDDEVQTSNLFPVRSPMEGVIVSCDVVPGEVVDAKSTIFAVADVDHMWLTLDVRLDDAKYLAVGQTVLFRPSGRRDDPEVRGKLAWVSTEADVHTRTVKVRASLPNTDGRLRSNTFGTGRIVLRDEPKAVIVPSEAIHSDGDCQIVFVRDKNFLKPDAFQFFHVREVRVGVKTPDTTEIIVGLAPGEVTAGKNSVVLESQLLKNKLGEGCGCCSPAK
jgi:membrane fusion protein, heavy metal efflux system